MDSDRPMIISILPKGLTPTTIRLGRVFIAAAGIAILALALYRIPAWLDAWNAGAVVGAITSAATILVLAVVVALRGSARVVERVAMEVSLLVCALLAAEAVLLLRAPEKWSDDPVTSAPRAGKESNSTAGCAQRSWATCGRKAWTRFRASRQA
jgi:hypothetical protein